MENNDILNNLIAVGLTEHQALTYAQLIESSKIVPASDKLPFATTRTNTYKILDKLVKLGLAKKSIIDNSTTYTATNPISISRLVAKQRNIAVLQEAAAQRIVSELSDKYRSYSTESEIRVHRGKQSVIESYNAVIKPGNDILFLRSPSDITSLGFETMHTIRTIPSRKGVKREFITPDKSTIPKEPETNRTWVKAEDYSSPVEWMVSGDTILIVIFSQEIHSIQIDSPLVASAFREIFCLLRTLLREASYYPLLPRK